MPEKFILIVDKFGDAAQIINIFDKSILNYIDALDKCDKDYAPHKAYIFDPKSASWKDYQ